MHLTHPPRLRISDADDDADDADYGHPDKEFLNLFYLLSGAVNFPTIMQVFAPPHIYAFTYSLTHSLTLSFIYSISLPHPPALTAVTQNEYNKTAWIAVFYVLYVILGESE
jgi:hypothetical protein